MQLMKPNHLISLASSAVLVSLDINVWSATKQDRVISDEVTSSKNADKDSGRFVKNILANHPKHKAIVNYRQTIYNWLQRRTYRWNNSQDLLPSVDVPKFKAEFNEHNTDFRCSIAQDIADDLFSTLSVQTQGIIESIQQEQSQRFLDVMQSISHCCGVDDLGNGKTKKRKIYETTIQKARDYIDTFKGFNPSNDKILEEARVMLEDVLGDVKAEDIRDIDAIRNNVKDGIDDILSKFSSFSCV